MRRRTYALVLGWVLVAADPRSALAQASAPPAGGPSAATPAADAGKATPPLLDAAKRYYDDAIRFYQEGQYDAARAAFEASFALSKEPDLLYNLSTTAEKQGQLADAIRYAERYLEGKPNAEDTEQVRERIVRLRAQQAPVATETPPSVAASPTPPPPVPSQPTGTLPAEPKKSLPAPAFVLVGVGAALVLGGIGTGAAALMTARDIEGRTMISFLELQDLESRGSALNASAISLSVLGGAALVAGGVWLGVTLGRRKAHR